MADDENGCYTGNMTDSFKVECEKPFDVETEYRCYSLKLTYNSNEKMNSMERLVVSHLTIWYIAITIISKQRSYYNDMQTKELADNIKKVYVPQKNYVYDK